VRAGTSGGLRDRDQRQLRHSFAGQDQTLQSTWTSSTVVVAADWPLAGDLPDLDRFRERLRGWDLDRLPKLDVKALRTIDKTLNSRIPLLMQRFENPYISD
jgi:hypothetical protein